MIAVHERTLASSLPERSGALWAVAQRFSARADLPLPPAPARERLRALARAMDRFLSLDEVSPTAEHDFVEGAGAVLGVILIDHHPDARHRTRAGKHRVQLGDHGYFDPFFAIEAALESDDPRAALARQVATAEAEQRSEGPISRVVKSLSLQLAHTRPDLRIANHFDLDLSLASSDQQPFDVDLQRAVDSTREQAQPAVERVVARLVSMLPGASSPALSFAAVRDRLLPRLCAASLLDELAERVRSPLFSLAITSELRVALQVEIEGRGRYVRARELADWGLSDSQAISLALDNLGERSARFRLVREDTSYGALYVARSGDGLDSARLLLPALYEHLRARFGADAVVGVPHRDTFMVCGAQDMGLVAELRTRCEHTAARAPHRISGNLFRLCAPGALVVL
jgi:uncharacterized protein YtpQ (UPF0354 family)